MHSYRLLIAIMLFFPSAMLAQLSYSDTDVLALGDTTGKYYVFELDHGTFPFTGTAS